MQIIRIQNSPVNSNCYVLFSSGYTDCVIFDPGSKDSGDLLLFLKSNRLTPSYIILTHEHFDHIWGLNEIRALFDSKVICSRKCGDFITNKKRNLSVFYDQVGFEATQPDILIEDVSYTLKWANENFVFIDTQGHSAGSICIKFENYLFTGDTIIEDEKTVVKLPGGSKEELLKSLQLLNNNFKGQELIILPGHGNAFKFDNWRIEDSTNQ